MTRVWRLRFTLCWFFVAIIVFIMRALPALSMSVWICWAFVAVDTWNCCTRFAVFVSVVVFVCVSVLVVVVVIVDVASLLLFFLLVSIMCSTCYARLTPSTSLSLSYLCSSSSSLCRWHLDLGASAAIYQENSWAHEQRQLVFIFIPILRLHSFLPEVHCLAPRTLCCHCQRRCQRHVEWCRVLWIVLTFFWPNG